MTGFGERLRKEREKRGVSLEEISASTKIGTRNLKALEDEDLDKLPGGIFNKGFVRAYARFLGLDEESTVAQFDEAWKEHQSARGLPLELPLHGDEEPAESSHTWLFVVAVFVLLVIAAAYLKLHR